MDIVMTGGTGHLGANVARELLGHGLSPRLLVRPHASLKGIQGLTCRTVQGDLLDVHSLRRAFEGATVVLHLAGLVRFDPPSAALLHHVHVEGTRNVLYAARQAGVRRLVYVSAAAALGHGTLTQQVTEETFEPLHPGQPFGLSKRAAERLVLDANSGPMEALIVSPTLMVGPYDVKPTTGEILRAVQRGHLRFYPDGGHNFVSTEDVARGLHAALVRGRPGERYLLGGENLTFREFLTQCAEEAGAPPPWLPAPRQVVLGAARAGDWMGWFFPERTRWLNTPVLEELFQTSYVSSQKAARELGYAPGPVRHGIRAGLRWFQENGYLPRDRPLTPHGGPARAASER